MWYKPFPGSSSSSIYSAAPKDSVIVPVSWPWWSERMWKELLHAQVGLTLIPCGPSYPSDTGGSSWGRAMCKEKGVCILNIDHEFHSVLPMHCFLETREQILKRYHFILVTVEEKSQKIKLKSQVPAVIWQMTRLPVRSIMCTLFDNSILWPSLQTSKPAILFLP